MIRVTLDTNVLAVGFLQARLPGSTVGEVVRRWRREDFDVIASDHIATELTRTFEKPYFRQGLTAPEVADARSSFRTRAEFVELTGSVSGVAAHRHDDPVLETAVAGRADYLVTGDAELLALGTYEGVVILTPRDFLDVLDRPVDVLPSQE